MRITTLDLIHRKYHWKNILITSRPKRLDRHWEFVCNNYYMTLWTAYFLVGLNVAGTNNRIKWNSVCQKSFIVCMIALYINKGHWRSIDHERLLLSIDSHFFGSIHILSTDSHFEDWFTFWGSIHILSTDSHFEDWFTFLFWMKDTIYVLYSYMYCQLHFCIFGSMKISILGITTWYYFQLSLNIA